MARRIRKSLWARTFQRSLSAMTRATLRAAKKATLNATRQAAKQAAMNAKRSAALAKRAAKRPAKSPTKRPAKRLSKPAAVPRPPPAGGGGLWSTGVATGPGGARRYRLYRPPGALASERLPMLVMLHGCGQDASSFALSTRLQGLAARERFFVLWPEQDRLAHSHGCWHWYATRTGRALGEAASIVAAVEQACTRHGADPERVAIAGLSAGACMAALVATSHPAHFKAVAMHSGVAPGAANSTASAFAAMHGRRKPTPRPAVPGAAALPPLLVIQGSVDRVVVPSNGRAVAQWWADATGAAAGPERTVQRGQRYPASITDFKRGRRTLVSLAEVRGLGHAWSGGAASQPFSDPKGPDAARMIWAFAQRQFRSVVR